MKLTVIGCSGTFPGPRSSASCYLVRAQHGGRTWSLVLDLGNGALGALQRHVDLDDVDVVALSHLHPDHCVDLAAYYVERTYRPGGRLPRLPVLGPSETPSRMAGIYGAPDGGPGLTKVFEFISWEPDREFASGPFRLRVKRVKHPVEAYAVRVECAGRTLVYSGDTGPCAALVELARGADLMLCEASFLDGDDNPDDLHMTGREAGEHAAQAKVGRLLLTHIPPWHEPERILAEARPAFSGPIGLAHPGATYHC